MTRINLNWPDVFRLALYKLKWEGLLLDQHGCKALKKLADARRDSYVSLQMKHYFKITL